MIEPTQTAALLADRFGPKIRPIAYVCHLPRMTAKAREFGYALAVHGSLQRDMDLIAVPWSDVASDEQELLQALCETVGGFMLPDETGCDKPHGRRAWAIHLGAGLYIDLSIMPRANQGFEISPAQKLDRLIAEIGSRRILASLDACKMARALAERLRAIHETPEYQAVWVHWQAHCGQWHGPQYAAELAALEAALLLTASPAHSK